MQNTNANANEGIDKRTIKAARESMSIDRHAGEAGEYDVYSESGNVYRVCLITETCECPSAEYQEGLCKHVRRVEMELGQREVPDLEKETDVELMMAARNKRSRSNPKQVATDGGVSVENPVAESPSRARDLITGPWTEPIEQGGQNYWKCADCGRESLRRGDLEHSTFHASGCVGR